MTQKNLILCIIRYENTVMFIFQDNDQFCKPNTKISTSSVESDDISSQTQNVSTFSKEDYEEIIEEDNAESMNLQQNGVRDENDMCESQRISIGSDEKLNVAEHVKSALEKELEKLIREKIIDNLVSEEVAKLEADESGGLNLSDNGIMAIEKDLVRQISDKLVTGEEGKTPAEEDNEAKEDWEFLNLESEDVHEMEEEELSRSVDDGNGVKNENSSLSVKKEEKFENRIDSGALEENDGNSCVKDNSEILLDVNSTVSNHIEQPTTDEIESQYWKATEGTVDRYTVEIDGVNPTVTELPSTESINPLIPLKIDEQVSVLSDSSPKEQRSPKKREKSIIKVRHEGECLN